MMHREVFYLVLILCAFMQVTINGLFKPLFYTVELRRKIEAIRDSKYGPVKPNGPVFEACNLCVWGSCTPAIQPLPVSEFHAEEDASRLKAARGKSRKVSKVTFTNILTSRSESQRKLISENLKTNGGLAKYVASSGDGTWHMVLMQALATPLTDFYVDQFQLAIKSQKNKEIGTNGRIAMLEMFTSLPPCLMNKIITAYNSKKTEKRFVTDIESSLKYFSQTDYIDVFKILAEGHRDEDMKPSWLKAYKDAKRMKEVIETQHVSKMKVVFREIFTKRSIPQLKETFRLYENLRQGATDFTSLHDDIDTHMESVSEIYATIVKIVQNQTVYFASIFDTIFEMYTDNVGKFISLIRACCDIDLGDIKEAYEKTYTKSLLSRYEEVAKRDGPFYEAVVSIIK